MFAENSPTFCRITPLKHELLNDVVSCWVSVSDILRHGPVYLPQQRKMRSFPQVLHVQVENVNLIYSGHALSLALSIS